METTSTAAWAGPYEFHLAKNWAAHAAPADDAQIWAPAVGHPLQYASVVDIFDSSYSHQPYVVPSSSYSSGGQQQLVEYNYYAASVQHHDTDPVETYIDPDPVEKYINNPEKLFQERRKKFKEDAELMKTKMHRYPPSIQALGDGYTVPMFVAIGPYYHGQDHLQKAETMKHVAAAYCIQEYKKVNDNSSGHSVRLLYDEVVSVVWDIGAHGLYDKDVMEGISFEDDFLPMMFYDACFLVTYILRKSGKRFRRGDTDLYDFFESNDNDIALDIMLLENQIPLELVEAVMNLCTEDSLVRMKKFIAIWQHDGFLLDRAERGSPLVDDWRQEYYDEAPHLLGLLRFYAIGKRSSSQPELSPSDLKKIESMPISAGPVELAEMGIFLTAKETMDLTEMGLAKKWIIFDKLSMASLTLNDARARWLVNMAALELCTTPDFYDKNAKKFEDSAICSYLLVLSMLMHREEDVHQLRTKGILKGAGLDNKKTLDFFTSLHSLRKGRGYVHVMLQISNYTSKRRHIIAVWVLFVYNNWKYFVGFGTAIAGIISIISKLKGLKGN